MEPHLRGLLEARSLRWIFVGGKGGVGKTTCSCSLAVQLAAVRESVLLISTDPAHNISDALRQKFSRHPTLVEGFSNLYALEIDPTPEQDVDAGAEGQESFLSEITASIPGIDEAMSFAEVLKQVQTLSFDVVVFDTAPTGHTLRLLQLPATLEKSLGKLMSLQSGLGGMVSSLMAMIGGAGGDVSEENMFTKLQGLKEMVEHVNAQFRDASLTTFVCVACPEFLSLYETERLVQELARNDIDVHNVIINQVLFPEKSGCSRLMAARIRMQERYLSQFHDLYEDFHVLELPLLADEVRGVDALREFSALLMLDEAERRERIRQAEPDPVGAEAELAALRQENAALRAALAAHGIQA